MLERDVLVGEMIIEIERCMAGGARYLDLAQMIWNVSRDLNAPGDRPYREYLQWFEGNLDMLVNLGGAPEVINAFLADQLDRLRMSVKDQTLLTSAPWREALDYLSMP